MSARLGTVPHREVYCFNIKQRKVERPSLEQLKEDIENIGYSGTGRKYGVSDNSIRKWIKLGDVAQW